MSGSRGKMNRDWWNKVEEAYHAARELSGKKRSRFLDEACRTDAAMRRQIEVLLEQDENPNTFLNRPAVKTDSDYRQLDKRPAWWMYVVAASFLLLHLVEDYLTVWGPAFPEGLATAFERGTMRVRSVMPGTMFGRAGLQAGDRVVAL